VKGPPAVAQAVAEAVALQGVREGASSKASTDDEALRLLRQAHWRPRYHA